MSSPATYPTIQPGDALAIVAPASSPLQSELDAAINSLGERGYRVKTYRPLCDPLGFLSGTDEARAGELMQAFTDPEVSGIMAARGGYGVGRLLALLDYDVIRQNPRVVAGYSDITALHVALDQRAGLVSFHSPNAIDGLNGQGKLDSESIDSFWLGLGPTGHCTRELLPESGHSLRTLSGGVGQGRLLGGNLAVLCGLIGSPYEPDTIGRILLLEEIGEAPYQVDRMMRQLLMAGKLSSLAGVVLGSFTECEGRAGAPTSTALQVLEEYLAGLGIPVLAGVPVGHATPNLTLPHGAMLRLDADHQRLTLLA